MKLKKFVKFIFYFFLLVLAVMFGFDYWISYKTASYIYYNSENLPHRPIGIVLGTSKYIPRGGINPYYANRINGAIELYKKNKISYLLLSGDNTFKSYNEPITMQKDLIKADIPLDSIFLDYAGFRTLDSIIRASKVFNVDDFTIITQQFHCERAVFIAMNSGIKAQCFAVPNPEKISMIRMRETFARVMALIDIYILEKEPKFLGPATPIVIDESEYKVTEPDLDNNLEIQPSNDFDDSN